MSNREIIRAMIEEEFQQLVDNGMGRWGPSHFELTDKYYATIKKEREEKKKLSKAQKIKKHCFITIQDYQRRLCDIEKLQVFIKRIAYMYEEGHWIIESGKSDPPNIHIHLLVKIKNSKKHKASLNAKWMALFNTDLQGDNDYYQLLTHNESPDMPAYPDWFAEKLNYFDNELKGTHKNLVDLELRGEF